MQTNLKLLVLMLIGLALAADASVIELTPNAPVVRKQSQLISSLPNVVGGYPVNLPLCALGQNLQTCLDNHGKIRLERGDYRIGNVVALFVRNGQQIYALPGTMLPEIKLQAGTEKVILSGVTTTKVDFVRSSFNAPIRFNLFIRVHATFVANGSAVEQNIFTYCNGPLHVNTETSGYLRNNRFIGSHAHGPSDMIYMIGDKNRLSYGNAFLWYAFQTPIGRATHIENQLDISLIGIDAETWNIHGEDPTWSPMLDLDKTSALRLLGANGGNFGLYPTPYLRANVDEIQILDMNVYRPAHGWSPKAARSTWDSTSNILLSQIFFCTDNQLSWISNFSGIDVVSGSPIGAHFEAFQAGNNSLKLNGVNNINSIDAATVKDLRRLFAPAKRPGEPWEAASFKSLPDPAGQNWKALVAGAIRRGTDDSSRIQEMIDSSPSGVGLLPEGVYYIAKPLVVGKNKGLVGAGRDKTLILALSDSLDMIVPGDPPHQNPGGTQTFILSDLTLQGGRSGIFHSSSNTGAWTQLNDVFLSYVQFREMADAGILFMNIFGWDNNFFDHIAFVNCKTGFKQSFPTTPKAGENADNNYVDKTIFYRSQFIGNRLAVDLSAHRADNLNAFIYSLFINNEEGAIYLQNTNTTLLAGSQFIGNGGSAVVNMSNSRYTSVVGSRFIDGLKRNVFFSSGVNVEGSAFLHGKNGTGKVFKDGATNVTIYNSSSSVVLGDVINGVFINSIFPDTNFDRFFVLRLGGSIKIMSSDCSVPQGQMLWGSSL